MDHAAGMPIDPRVFEAMKPYYLENYGNASSSHSFGAATRNALMESREKVARLIGAEKPEEVIFSSGGTESSNLAIKGVVYRNKDKGNHIITTTIEHISIINICKHLQKQGFEITRIPVDRQGLVDPQEVEDAITDRTILVSSMYANGEIGTVQPIGAIGEIARENQICFHVDAVAAAGKIPINVEDENINLLSVSSNDMYGPKGIGVLYIKKGTRIQPVIQGGGQERGLRSGTENVPGIVGMGKAAELAQGEMEAEGRRLNKLQDKLIKGVLDTIESSYLNGHPTRRLPNNANLRFSYIEGESRHTRYSGVFGFSMYFQNSRTLPRITRYRLSPRRSTWVLSFYHGQAKLGGRCGLRAGSSAWRGEAAERDFSSDPKRNAKVI